MLIYVLKRLAYALPIALGVTVVIFLLAHLAPGDPISAIVGGDAPQAVVERLKAEYGFDRPLPVQYVLWLGRVLAGDLGRSIATGRPVAFELGAAVGNTFVLAVSATLVGFTVGAVLGVIAGYQIGRWPDRIASGLAISGVSVPHYWFGMVLVIIFSVEWNVLPAMGMGADGSRAWAFDLVHLRYLILPTITLAVIPVGVITRTVRAAVAETLNQEFVQTLRAKGLQARAVLLHVIKNVAPIVLSVMGLQLGYLLGGSILVEVVFSWPGTGFLLNDAIFRRDLPMLQGTILVLAMFFVALNLIVDVLQTIVDPRMRRS